MINVLLVDDQNLVQQGIKSLLDKDPEIKVIGTVKDGRNAVKQVTKLRPDIVLLDIEMPDMDGITATKYITHLAPYTKVIILSSHEENKYVTRALMAGAKSYILKTSLIADLRQSILAVNNGYSQIESRLLSRIFDSSRLKQRQKKSRDCEDSSSNKVESPVEPASKPTPVLTDKASEQNDSTQITERQTVANSKVESPVEPASKPTPVLADKASEQNDSTQITERQTVANSKVESPVEPASKPTPVLADKASEQNDSTQITERQIVANSAADSVIFEGSEEKIEPIKKAPVPSAKTDLTKKTDKSNGLHLKSQNETATLSQIATPENKSLPTSSASQANSRIYITPANTNKESLDVATSNSQKDFRQIINSSIFRKYKLISVRWWSDSKTYYAPVKKKCLVQFDKYQLAYQSRLLPTLKHWQEKGWLANVGLIFLGLITVIIIHRMFS